MVTVEEARVLLVQAHRTRGEAERALDDARAAAERAHQFVEEARDHRDGLQEKSRSIAADRSEMIKAAIISGHVPMFENAPPGLSANAAALSEAESRLQSAETACADIEAAEDEAQHAMSAARDRVRVATQEVALAEADAMAQEIEEYEGRALRLRALLGNSLSPVGQFPQMTDALRRVIVSTDDMGDVFLRRGDLWNTSKRAAPIWRQYLGGLMADSNARLDFDAPVAEATAKAA